MNRTEQIERAIDREGLPMTSKMAIGFKLGAFWADTHPVYEDGIPLRADKTPGECLLLVKKLCYCKGASDTFKALHALVKENIDRGCSPFYGIGYFVKSENN